MFESGLNLTHFGRSINTLNDALPAQLWGMPKYFNCVKMVFLELALIPVDKPYQPPSLVLGQYRDGVFFLFVLFLFFNM